MSVAGPGAGESIERPPSWRLLLAGIWLIWLQSAYAAAWDSPSQVARAVSLTALTLFAIGYVLAFRWTRLRPHGLGGLSARNSWVVVGTLVVLGLLTLPGAGEEGLSTGVYLVATSAIVLPRVHRVLAVVGIAASTILAEVLVPGWTLESSSVFAILLAAVAAGGVAKVIERNNQLGAAREEIAHLAVAAERSRLARDLHDILGHSLTVITVKAELAGRLMELDPARAAAEVRDIERLSREALADVRTTISGRREVSLAREIASAGSALAGAGIEADLPTALDEVPGDRRELFGWAVREGVTNVVRHSGATHCRIRVQPHSLEIVDDGHGPGASDDGNGLHGLRERVQAAGGRLAVGRADADGGFALRVDLPMGRV